MKRPHVIRGQIILLALVFFAVVLGLTSALISYVFQYSKSERYSVASTQALALAEGGLDEAAYQLNQNSGYAGESNTVLGKGTFTVSVTSIDASTKRITVTAYVPNSTSPVATKSVQANVGINSSVVSFRFGVQVGNGGVSMGSNSQINGNLYTNGSVVGAGGSNGMPYITGDVTVAGGTQSSPDQQATTQNGSQNLGDKSADTYLAQSFKPSSSMVINKVSLYLEKIGTPSDLTFRIETDSSGKPSGTAVASGNLPASSVGTSYGFVDGTLTSSPTLTGGQTYWIKVTSTVNASNYFVWGRDTTDSYASGTAKSSANNSTWSALNSDLDFEAWMGGVVTSLSGVHVGGTAWAHSLSNCQIDKNAIYQSISSCTVAGTQTVSTSDASPAAMPISSAEIAAWENTATAGGVTSGNYTISGTQTLGPREIDGDLTVNGTLYMAGPIWVKGNITFGNNSGLIVAASTGSNGAVIIADYPGSETSKGIVTLSNNMTISGNGNSGSFPMVLSTYSGASTAITMSNNATSVILYAPNGIINVINNAVANQITAKTLILSNGTSVDYVNGLQSQSFSNGPGGSWTFVPGSYAITR